jgi:hypothetical protein
MRRPESRCGIPPEWIRTASSVRAEQSSTPAIIDGFNREAPATEIDISFLPVTAFA